MTHLPADADFDCGHRDTKAEHRFSWKAEFMSRMRHDYLRLGLFALVLAMKMTMTGSCADVVPPLNGTGDPSENPGLASFLLVDDFESYTDEEGQRIYETWIDGWITGNGSLVGYTCAPFIPHPILIHSGRQDMPFSYDNSLPPHYSEAYRAWETPQDWTIHGGTDLTLWLHGAPVSFLEDPNGRIIVNGPGGDADGTSEGYCFVRKQLTGDGEIVARVDGLNGAKGWARAGVMIRDAQDGSDVYAALTVTAEHGGSFTYRAGKNAKPAQIGAAGIQTPQWAKLTRTGSTLTPRYSADGKTWLDVKDDKGQLVTVTMEMSETVCIGLCAISDDWARLVQAEFSEVATSGSIQGPWLTTETYGCNYSEINCRDRLYLALEDAAGKKTTVVHPDPAAVNLTEWTQWQIPLSDFAAAGVDVKAITKMHIGVGNRENPQPNGAGMIQIDDIYVTQPLLAANPSVRARYYEGFRLEKKPVVTRAEDSIDHDWGQGEVVEGLSDDVSARWTAHFEVPADGVYTLTVSSNDSAVLWLNGWLLNYDWARWRVHDEPTRLHLEAGHLYALRMEWSHKTGDAKAQLWWEGPPISRQIVPSGALQLPLRAAGPYPAHEAVNVARSLLLMWYAGEDATHQEIYFGDNADAVANATPATVDIHRGRLTAKETVFDPGVLDPNKTYFWRVDGIDDANAAISWRGDVWRFTTADFLVIDDFESYSDEEGNRIYENWIDAFVPSWISVIPNIPPGPYAEREIVHGGRQSMPIDYNNADEPWFWEVEREFAPIQNWLVNGVDTLVLYVHGQGTNARAPLYMTIRDTTGKSSTVRHADVEVTQVHEWTEWRIPLSQFTGVNPAKVKRLTLGVGDRDNPIAGGVGRIYIDDIRVMQGGEGNGELESTIAREPAGRQPENFDRCGFRREQDHE